MKTFINIKRLQFYLVVGTIWLCLWTLNSFFSSRNLFQLEALNEIWQIAYLIIANYIFFEYSLSNILKKRSSIIFNILIGIPLIAIHLLIVSFGLYFWIKLGMHLNIYTILREVTLSSSDAIHKIMVDVIYYGEAGVISTLFFGVAKLLHYNFKLRQTTQLLKLEKQEAELNYLKSQTNPHFLFNTLNNIYSLARKNSNRTPESILRLSQILRFMLYETGGSSITIGQELEIINDYIALEQLRYDNTMRINFTHEVEDMNQTLPPLLLIPLVENAFKHGASETTEQAFVDINLSVNNDQLKFEVKNSIETSTEKEEVIENIGLSNLRRQLELLYLDYNLSIKQDESTFTATLNINLSSHV